MHEYLALRELSVRYAFAVDDGDGASFASAFLPDARLRMFRPGDGLEPSVRLDGAAALRTVPADVQSRYATTLHLLGQSGYDVRGDTATGTTYCIAHHVESTPHGGVDHVMHIRYADTYRRDPGGDWLIAERVGICHWTETRAIDQVRS
jgi:ketosteroid isomerase-like protein